MDPSSEEREERQRREDEALDALIWLALRGRPGDEERVLEMLEETTMSDPTEPIRRLMVAQINAEEARRADLEARYGQAWSTAELQRDFEVLGFLAPFVRVVRKADGVEGLMMFQHMPRYYFDFKEK